MKARPPGGMGLLRGGASGLLPASVLLRRRRCCAGAVTVRALPGARRGPSTHALPPILRPLSGPARSPWLGRNATRRMILAPPWARRPGLRRPYGQHGRHSASAARSRLAPSRLTCLRTRTVVAYLTCMHDERSISVLHVVSSALGPLAEDLRGLRGGDLGGEAYREGTTSGDGAAEGARAAQLPLPLPSRAW